MKSKNAVIIHSLCLVLNSHTTTLLFSKDDMMFIFTAFLMLFNFWVIVLTLED